MIEPIEAMTQYNDLQGTAAADYSDDRNRLDELVRRHGVDTSQTEILAYEADVQGDFFALSVLVRDRAGSTEVAGMRIGKQLMARRIHLQDASLDDFLGVFKRLAIVLPTDPSLNRAKLEVFE